MYIWMDGCIYICMYGCMYTWMDGWMDIWMYMWMDGCINMVIDKEGQKGRQPNDPKIYEDQIKRLGITIVE